jgi:hypothetical protein
MCAHPWGISVSGITSFFRPRVLALSFSLFFSLFLCRRVTISLKGLGAHLVGGAEEEQNAKGTMLFKVGCAARVFYAVSRP